MTLEAEEYAVPNLSREKHFPRISVPLIITTPINILIYIQQDATLHSLFYLETTLHDLGGTSTHHQERKQLYLQHLVFVTPSLLPGAIASGSSDGDKYYQML